MEKTPRLNPAETNTVLEMEPVIVELDLRMELDTVQALVMVQEQVLVHVMVPVQKVTAAEEDN
jgi:hypothetical protein